MIGNARHDLSHPVSVDAKQGKQPKCGQSTAPISIAEATITIEHVGSILRMIDLFKSGMPLIVLSAVPTADYEVGLMTEVLYSANSRGRFEECDMQRVTEYLHSAVVGLNLGPANS
jgi:hypothetical protein